MKILLIFSLLVMLFGCNEITINENDSTPPLMTAAFAGRQNLAIYQDTGADATGEPLSPARDILVRPRSDSEKISLLISAVDSESAIRSIRAQMRVSYKCVARAFSGNMEKNLVQTFSNIGNLQPLDHGDTGNDTTAILVSFTYKDLWTSACMNWGQIIDVRSGTLQNINVEYEGVATNNALEQGMQSISGSFKVSNGRVSLD